MSCSFHVTVHLELNLTGVGEIGLRDNGIMRLKIKFFCYPQHKSTIIGVRKEEYGNT